MNYISRGQKILNSSLVKTGQEKKATQSAVAEWIRSCPTPGRSAKKRTYGHATPWTLAGELVFGYFVIEALK